jgi:MoaA/NifB/PqqE/SkfB family radical SAM enzyme
MKTTENKPGRIAFALGHSDKVAFEFLTKLSPRTIDRLFVSPHFIKLISRIFQLSSRQACLSYKEYPRQVQMDKYYITRSLIRSLALAISGMRDKPLIRKSLSRSVFPAMFASIRSTKSRVSNFHERYGFDPPTFLVLSPSKACNLRCAGCYADSDSESADVLPYPVVDRILKEKSENWGSIFTVLSGGEPLLYKSCGKTIVDLARDHQDNYFLMYTNGTLIDGTMARKLAEVGNITPAISVEGYELETDARRGKGVYSRVLAAMENLREEGVPFGVSITVTKENAHLVPSESLMKYYSGLGALYFWIFQLMPIGRASVDLIVTPEQRLDMYKRMFGLIRNKRYFIADFWNGGTLSDGCISAGRIRGGGYLYIDWAGNVTPCVFNPYAAANIKEIYSRGGSIDEVLTTPYFESIQRWQGEYELRGGKHGGNWVLPCPMRDHYPDMLKILRDIRPKPTDQSAREALGDDKYQAFMFDYNRRLEKLFSPLWNHKYLHKE